MFFSFFVFPSLFFLPRTFCPRTKSLRKSFVPDKIFLSQVKYNMINLNLIVINLGVDWLDVVPLAKLETQRKLFRIVLKCNNGWLKTTSFRRVSPFLSANYSNLSSFFWIFKANLSQSYFYYNNCQKLFLFVCF